MTDLTGRTDRSLVVAEFENVRDAAAHKARAAEKRIEFWNYVHIGGGSVSAAAAAAAGGAGLADAGLRVLAGFLALTAAALTAALAFVRAEERLMANRRSHRTWAAVEREARASIALLPGMSDQEARDALASAHRSSNAAHEAYTGDSPQR
ncbi:hypothetical protein ACFYWY_32025 [Streptomyces sp. NPDC002870]|uniref:hypothetical protein n=1 Tax=Streptomyces sp. NPDC002870 TaxID=3364666 RepID=UPI0036860DF4